MGIIASCNFHEFEKFSKWILEKLRNQICLASTWRFKKWTLFASFCQSLNDNVALRMVLYYLHDRKVRST